LSGTGADDLHGLMGHLRTGRFHMVGTGAGAFICIDYASSSPRRLRSVVIATTIGGVQDEESLELFWRFCCSRKARTRTRGSSRRTVTRLSRTTTAAAYG